MLFSLLVFSFNVSCLLLLLLLLLFIVVVVIVVVFLPTFFTGCIQEAGEILYPSFRHPFAMI